MSNRIRVVSPLVRDKRKEEEDHGYYVRIIQSTSNSLQLEKI